MGLIEQLALAKIWNKHKLGIHTVDTTKMKIRTAAPIIGNIVWHDNILGPFLASL